MKRRRISRVTDSNANRGRTKTGEPSSFSDLPRDILVNILLRLSIKSILAFKNVCKAWYDLVLDPEFAKLHYDQAEVCPLIRTTFCPYGSKVVHLMQPDKADFDLKLGMCDHTFNRPGCVCNVRVKIDTKFEMPETYGFMKHRSEYGIVTCNNLLCLSYPSHKWLGSPIVCNPITGEFINLPEVENIGLNGYNTRYGFGFSSTTNQYKVLRMSAYMSQAHIHILGTNSWKNIGFFTQPMPKLSLVYLKGFLYWSSNKQRTSIFTFDIENECFGSILAPTANLQYRYDSVGVLGGDLCICGIHEFGDIRVWTLKDNGTEKAWSIVLSFEHLYLNGVRYFGSFQPIKYLNDGALLMYNAVEDALVYIDPKENRLRHMKASKLEYESKVEVMAYIPSFVSLKHTLSGLNVKVLNVRSRCTKLNLQNEADIDIVEE